MGIFMNLAKSYGDMVRRSLEQSPERAGGEIRLGLRLEALRCRLLADKRMPQAYRYLNSKALSLVSDALAHPETFVCTNIFAPVELLQNFGLNSVSMECLASFLSGFYLEDYFIDNAENTGIASTLCSYHKNFIGAVDSGVLPKPLLGVTTSMICDGNINTFRYLEEQHGVPAFVLDIPHEYSEEACDYVEGQLRALIVRLEKATGRRYDEAALRETIRRENRSRAHYLSFLRKRIDHDYPNTLTLILFMLFATHLNIGTEWAERFFAMLDEDVERYPASAAKRIFWIHLTPYAQETLRSYFNYGKEYEIVADDFNLDYIEEMDDAQPLHALARKMLCNIYNGDFSRKTQAVQRYVREYRCDAVIEFCHWGCKQSSGGVMLMKEAMRELGVPMLILDGDALDRRNSHDGQIKTRFEAFLEVMKNTSGGAAEQTARGQENSAEERAAHGREDSVEKRAVCGQEDAAAERAAGEHRSAAMRSARKEAV